MKLTILSRQGSAWEGLAVGKQSGEIKESERKREKKGNEQSKLVSEKKIVDSENRYYQLPQYNSAWLQMLTSVA